MGASNARRQARLPGREENPIPNYRVIQKPLLSATTLASWLYCRTKPFVQRLIEAAGIDVSTPAMRRGAAAHEEVQGALEALAVPSDLTLAEAAARKRFQFETETHLVDDERKMHGYVDIVYTREGRVQLLELKNTRGPQRHDPLWGAPVWPEHGIQLHFYGILGRTTYGLTPQLSLSYLQGGSKLAVLSELASSSNPESALLKLTAASVPLPHGTPERQIVLAEVAGFQRAEKELDIPTPTHANPAVCAQCSVRTWCVRRLDRPGTFVGLTLPDAEP